MDTSLRIPRGRLAGLQRPWSPWEWLWPHRGALQGELLTLAALLAVLVVNGLGYPTVARFATWRGVTAFDPELALDRLIPALPWTVALYWSMYFYYPLGILSAPRCDEGRWELVAHVQTQVVVALASFFFFLFLPAEIRIVEEMKAQLPEAPGWIRLLFASVYAVDRPYNAWPSLHVSQSLIVVLSLQRWSGLAFDGRRPWIPTPRRRRLALALLWTAWSAMALSILTTRQHYFFDGLTGALLALLAWRYVFLPTRSLAPAAPAPASTRA